MWQIPVVLGLGTIVAAVASASRRKPLPIDVAATLRASLQSKSDASIKTTLGAMQTKYPAAVSMLEKAWGATKSHTGALNVPADIDGLYMTAFYSGDPALLKKTAQALDVKYHFLSTHLLAEAQLLANLEAKAA